MRKSIKASLLALLATTSAHTVWSAENTLAFTAATIIDGVSDAPIIDGTLISTNGRIVAVGPSESIEIPPEARVIDLSGKTIMPGIINSHGHVGDVQGLESGHYTRDNLQRQLELYARYGVTTVNSLGNDEFEGFAIRNEQDPLSQDRARLLVAGPVINATTEDQARIAVRSIAAQSPNFIKIRVDDNLGRTPKMAPNIYKVIAEESEANNIPLAVHLYYLEDAKKSLAAGADFIAHSVRDTLVDDELINALKQANVCYSPTLTRELSTFVYEGEPFFFNDPFFLREVAPQDIATLRDSARQKRIQQSASAQRYKNEALPNALQNVKLLADAGVRIAMGTDSGPAARFQGYFEHLEMHMMVEAGMTPMEVIKASTSVAADCLGLNYLGSLEQGYWSDIVVLEANPLDDIENTKTISEVWIAGNPVPMDAGGM
ncbi:MAG: amidohydrolase family protein [Pseudohongiellaceae bacterium]|nr:amidohydrolase family protein [Pseudohongiellaceae bacterium]